MADANGDFSIKITNKDGINQLDFLAVDPYGHQIFRAFPILWLGFSKHGGRAPRQDLNATTRKRRAAVRPG